MSETKKWHAVYTKPRWEKKVFALLEERGLIAYCPLNKVRKKWSDRYKIINEPLFKSYVFVKIDDSEQANVRALPGIVNFIYWNGKPAIIKEREIEGIQMLLKDFVKVEIENMTPDQKGHVKIASGFFANEEGVLLRKTKNKVEVLLINLGYRLIAYIGEPLLKPSI